MRYWKGEQVNSGSLDVAVCGVRKARGSCELLFLSHLEDVRASHLLYISRSMVDTFIM